MLSMNQVVGLNALMEIYFDTDCDCLPSTLRKQRSRLKIRLLNYYRNQIMIFETTSSSSAVVINSANVKYKVTMTENHEELITKAAVSIRSDIEEYCKKVAMTLLHWPPALDFLHHLYHFFLWTSWKLQIGTSVTWLKAVFSKILI